MIQDHHVEALSPLLKHKEKSSHRFPHRLCSRGYAYTLKSKTSGHAGMNWSIPLKQEAGPGHVSP